MSLPIFSLTRSRLSPWSVPQSGGHMYCLWSLPLWTSLPSGGMPHSQPCVFSVRPLSPGGGTLSLPWHDLLACAFPPLQLHTKILTKLCQSNTQLVLVAPAWPSPRWFPDLLELSLHHLSSFQSQRPSPDNLGQTSSTWIQASCSFMSVGCQEVS